MAQLVAVSYQDTEFDTAAPDANYGTKTTFAIGPTYNGPTKSDLERAIGNFDLTPIPPGANVTTAKLQRWLEGVQGGPLPATLYRCTRPATWTEYGCTWNKYDGTNAWTAAGGDWDATTPAPVAFVDEIYGLKEITGLLDFAKDAIANRSGIVSLILKADTETGSTHRSVWDSREYADPAQRWRLVVDYDDTQRPGSRGTLPGAGERRPRAPWAPANGRRPTTYKPLQNYRGRHG